MPVRGREREEEEEAPLLPLMEPKKSWPGRAEAVVKMEEEEKEEEVDSRWMVI